ncbi:hypothetical protein N7456_009479 [Penicillium angulare]|uniref:Uncharacterized protein n=1 Tax=Penicillium angulare TaxID=116970 RepID=A0A9W9F4P6_9EURO|nr:hypothetical protein N7456_009479 [Penicillium angulare]
MKRPLTFRSKSGQYGLLEDILERTHALKDDFPSVDDLQRLRFRISRVEKTYDDVLQFEPSFFQPHFEKAPQKYKVVQDEYLNDSTEREFYEKIPNLLIAECPTKGNSSPGELEEHIVLQKYGGIEEWITDLWPEQIGVDKGCRFFPYVHKYGRSLDNRCVDLRYQYAKDSHWGSQPHKIIHCISDVRAMEPEDGPTVDELRVITWHMAAQTCDPLFRDCRIHPMLVLSFMGPQQARIIQVTWDGKEFHLQYSQLWSFAIGETAPLDMFLRYHIAQPVGVISSSVIASDS